MTAPISRRRPVEDLGKAMAEERNGPAQLVAPEIQRVGIGYVAHFPAIGIQLRVSYLKTRSGESKGELTVTAQPAGRPNLKPGHLFQGSFNFSSLTTRTSTARYLQERWPADWVSILEQTCLGVLQLERQGEPWHDLESESFPLSIHDTVSPILPLNAPTVLFAPFGAGKSTLAGALVVSVALGIEVVPGWKPMSGPVVILDWEDHPLPWQERLRAIARGVGSDQIGPVRYRSCYRPLTDDLEGIASYCDEVGAAMVVVDSIGLAAGVSEGAAEETSVRFFAALRALGRTALLIDQVSGETAQRTGPATKSYGSIFKMYLASNAFELRREKEPQDGTAEVVLINTKRRGGRKLSPIGLAFEYANGENPEWIRVRRTEVQAHDLQESLPHHLRMARLLGRQGAMSVKAIADELQVSPAMIRALASRHKDKFGRMNDERLTLLVQDSLNV